MKRVLYLALLAVFTLVICARTFSRPTSDEDTVKNLEMDSAKHAGFSDADVAFGKSTMAAHETFIDPLGHVYEQSPADYEKMAITTRAANPDAKATIDISDIKVRVSGDTATALIHGTYTSSGYKEPSANVSGAQYVAIDTWQKQSGKWKIIAGAAVSTGPIPAEAYKTPPPAN